jgi:hypothetical protein
MAGSYSSPEGLAGIPATAFRHLSPLPDEVFQKHREASKTSE